MRVNLPSVSPIVSSLAFGTFSASLRYLLAAWSRPATTHTDNINNIIQPHMHGHVWCRASGAGNPAQPTPAHLSTEPQMTPWPPQDENTEPVKSCSRTMPHFHHYCLQSQPDAPPAICCHRKSFQQMASGKHHQPVEIHQPPGIAGPSLVTSINHRM